MGSNNYLIAIGIMATIFILTISIVGVLQDDREKRETQMVLKCIDSGGEPHVDSHGFKGCTK